jgi:DNA replication and repair protein RecF
VTLVGPHRDEWRLTIGGLDSRTHASQGEQRTLALALRLAGPRVCAEIVGSAPVLLLDDVFSELDEQRASSLVKHLPTGQTLVTTAGSVPAGVSPDLRLRVAGGAVRPEEA